MLDTLVQEKAATSATSSSQGDFGTHPGINAVKEVIPTDATKELLMRISGGQNHPVAGGSPVFVAKNNVPSTESEHLEPPVVTNQNQLTIKATDGVTSPTERAQKIQIDSLTMRITTLTQQVQELILQLAEKNSEIAQEEVMAQVKVSGQIEQLRQFVQNLEQEVRGLKKDGDEKDAKIVALEEVRQHLKQALQEADNYNSVNPLFSEEREKTTGIESEEQIPLPVTNPLSETTLVAIIKKLEEIRSNPLKKAQRLINKAEATVVTNIDPSELPGKLAKEILAPQTVATSTENSPEEALSIDVIDSVSLNNTSLATEAGETTAISTMTREESATALTEGGAIPIKQAPFTLATELAEAVTAPQITTVTEPTLDVTVPTATINTLNETTLSSELGNVSDQGTAVSVTQNQKIAFKIIPEDAEETVNGVDTGISPDKKAITIAEIKQTETVTPVTLPEEITTSDARLNTIVTPVAGTEKLSDEASKIKKGKETNPIVSLEVFNRLKTQTISLDQMLSSPFGLLDKTVRASDINLLLPELKKAFEKKVPDELLNSELFEKFKNTKVADIYLSSGTFTGNIKERESLSSFIKTTLAFYIPGHTLPLQESETKRILAGSTLQTFWTVSCELYAERKVVSETAENSSAFMSKVFESLNLHNADEQSKKETLDDVTAVIYLHFLSELLYGKSPSNESTHSHNDTITISTAIEALRKAFAMDEKEALINKDHAYIFFMIALESFLLNEQYRGEILALFEQAKEAELAKLTNNTV